MYVLFLDSDEERAIPLVADDIRAESWNGYAVPIVSADALDRFVTAWRQADPNGTWGRVYVRVEDAALVVTRGDSDDSDDWDVWPTLGNGRYALDGWTWVLGSADDASAHGIDTRF